MIYLPSMKWLLLPILLLVLLISCKKEQAKTVTIHCAGLVTDTAGTGDNGRVAIPNAFTPNGDGINDVFRPLLINIASVDFRIYDASGTEVFSTSVIGQGYSSVTFNKPVRYYYRVQAITQGGRKIGMCGEFYNLGCFTSSPNPSQLYFEDQWTPFGFTGPTSEVLGNCP